jgi:hypothetical protein
MKWLLIAFLAGQALDQTTTAVAINRGCRERNPLVPTRVGPSIAVGITIGGGSAWALSRAHKEHPRLAKTVAAIGAGVRAGAGLYNLQKMDECGR